MSRSPLAGGLRVRPSKVLERSGKLEGPGGGAACLGCETQGAKGDGGACEIEGGLEAAVDRVLGAGFGGVGGLGSGRARGRWLWLQCGRGLSTRPDLRGRSAGGWRRG